MMRRGVVPVVFVGLLALGACAGPSVDAAVGVKELTADVVYGDQRKPGAPALPPAADPSPGFPGFIEPPISRTTYPLPGAAATTTTLPSTTPTTGALPACKAADPLGVTELVPTSGIQSAPSPGVYPYRQEGSRTIDGKAQPVPPEGERTVSSTAVVGPGVFRFEVTVTEDAQTTVTTYQVDQRGVQDGLYIAQIRSTDDFGEQVFTPAVPVKILELPAAVGKSWSSTGSDPVHGTSMQVHGAITAVERIDACGTWVAGWRVEIGPDPSSGQPSRIVSRTQQTELTASYFIATQYGGLVVADEVQLVGTATNRAGVHQVEIATKATINSIEPRPHPEEEG